MPSIPEQASTVAPQVDTLVLVLLGLALFFASAVFIAIVYLGIKYRVGAKKVDRSNPPAYNLKLEAAWIGVPLVLALGMFTWGARLYFNVETPPASAMQIYVVAKQWMWKFQHTEGQIEINQLHVPLGRPIKLVMISQDVIHSFFVPAFRVKQDVLPGRYTDLWFQATETGSYHLFCTQYCGTNHALMTGEVIVMDAAQYEAWLTGGNATQTPPAAGPQTAANASPASMAAAGQMLFVQFRCAGCHTPDGHGLGPSLVGLFGSQVKLNNGQTVVADEGYIRESILNPNAKIVAGYQPGMPSFQGQLSEEQLTDLIEFIKSQSGR